MQKQVKKANVEVSKAGTTTAIAHAAERLRGKELFPKKVERAKAFLSQVKQLPA